MKKIFIMACLALVAVCQMHASDNYRKHRYNEFKGLSVNEQSIVFVGNSITDMHNWPEAFGNDPRIVSRGVSGGYSFEMLANVYNWVYGHPAKVFIKIGTNDLRSGYTPQSIADNFQKTVDIVRTESPNTEIYIQSVLPAQDGGNKTDATIAETNKLLEDICKATEKCTYVDLNSKLRGVKTIGWPWSSDNDHLHISALSYQVWCKTIEPYMGGLKCVYPDNTQELQNRYGNTGNVGLRASYFSVQPTTAEDVIFFGDGFVQSGEWHELLPGSKIKNHGYNWEVSGSTIANVSTMVDATLAANGTIKREMPKAALLYTGSTSFNATDYENVVKKIHTYGADIKVYCVSLLPNISGYATANTSIKSICAKTANCEYIDVATTLAGKLSDTEYFNYSHPQYMTYVTVAQQIAAQASDLNLTALTSEQAHLNFGMAEAFEALTKCKAGTGVGQYPQAKLDAVKAAIQSKDANLANLVAELAASLNLPTATNVVGKQYILQTPNRGNRYAIGGSGTIDRADAFNNYSIYRWVFEPRQDGSYNIKNLGTKTYADPTSGYDGHMGLTANAPQKGWNFKVSNSMGTYAIYSEAAELNMSNNTNMWVYNWYDKNGSYPDLNDGGCQFAIIEAEGEPEDPKGIETDESWTIRAVFSSGAADRYLVNNNGTLAAVTEAPTTTAGHWVIGSDYVQSVADGKYLGVDGGFTLNASKVTISFSAGKTAGTQSIGEVASNGTRNGALNKNGTVSGGQFTNNKYNEYNGWSSDFIIEKVSSGKEHEGPYTIDKLNGDLFKDGSTSGQSWNDTWKSKDTPQLLFTASANNMTWSNNNLQIESGTAGSSAYTLTAPQGYIIKSFSFDFAAKTAGKTVTLATLQKNYTTSTTPQTISNNNYGRKNYSFSVTGTNGNSTILTNFIVEIEEGEEPEDLSGYKVFDNAGSTVPYRIPAVAKNQDGDLIFVTDYRYSKQDIGVVVGGKLDLRYRIKSADGTWSKVETLAQCIETPSIISFGDPCIVADRESNRVMVTSCCGNVSYPKGSHADHQGWARFYSEDGGKNWGKHTDISQQIFDQLDKRSDGQIKCFFIGSGKISQSSKVKVGTHYRLYCAALLKINNGTETNFVFYSDDFGENWKVLGDINVAPIPSGANEPKADELPDGSILVSSRVGNGRYFNIYHFTDVKTGAGSWGTYAFSTSSNNNGVLASSNGCNGEIMIVPVVRAADKVETHLLLQSAPFGPGTRSNVGINYKDLTEASSYATPAAIAVDWRGRYQVSMTTSAYSTMCMDKDGDLAFFYEENSYNNGYDMIYKKISIEDITDGAYSLLRENAEGVGQISQQLCPTSGTYDLQGRSYMSTPKSGLYIVNGKKIVR